MRTAQCVGIMHDGPNKAWVRCGICNAIDYEKNEGDRCTRETPIGCVKPTVTGISAMRGSRVKVGRP